MVLSEWRHAASAWPSAVLHAVGILLTLGVIIVAFDAPAWMLIGPWIYLFGRMSHATMHALNDAQDEPFSFALPGYRESLRRASFLAALCFGLGTAPLGLVLADHGEGLGPVEICIHLVNGFLVGVAVSLGAYGDLRLVVSRVTYGILLLLSIPFFFVGVIVVPAFFMYPALGISCSVGVCILMWLRLGDMAGVRRGHRMILEDALERRTQVGITRTASPEVGESFQGRMEHSRPLAAGLYIWGGLYRAFGMVFSCCCSVLRSRSCGGSS